MRLIVLFLVVLLASAPAHAGPDAAGLEAAAAFTAEVQELYQDGMAISFDLDETEGLVDSYYQGEIDEAGLTRAYGPARERARAAIDAYRARLAAGPAPPAIGDAPRERSLRAFAAMVEGLPGRLETQLAVVERLHRAALDRDEAAYRRASAESLALAADMVLDENIALESAQMSLAERHPQHGLNRAVIGGNEAIAAALRILEATYRDVAFDAAAYARGVADGLRRAERGIADGERATEALADSFAGRPAVTPQDEYSKAFIARLVEAYRHAFEIERRIARVERDFLEFLRRISSGAGAEAGGDVAVQAVSFQADLELRIGERMEAQMARLQMVQDYARTLRQMSQEGG